MRLTQVISDLVTNAVKHGADPIVVRAEDCGDRVALEVVSRGEVEEKIRPYIFDPFQPHSADVGVGLGLSLSIVVAVVRAHGGRVSLLPDTPGEPHFRVELPQLVSKAPDRGTCKAQN